MDEDAIMLYVKNNPDCSSIELSKQFNITIAKAFAFMNNMINKKLVFKTTIRSPTNNKRIYSYRVIPNYDEQIDNRDKSMRIGEIMSILRRVRARAGLKAAMVHLNAFNDWRKANKFPLINAKDVFPSAE